MAKEPTRVIMLNGPPGSGKDTAAELLGSFQAHHHEMKKVLHTLVREHYGVSEEEWAWMYRRENKESPQEGLGDKTPREAMIHISEDVIKPTHGPDYFAQRAADALTPNAMNVISDCGFPAEIKVMKERLGKENVLIVRLWRDGCDFSKDSRNYVYDNDCMSVDVRNTKTKAELRMFLMTWISQWWD